MAAGPQRAVLVRLRPEVQEVLRPGARPSDARSGALAAPRQQEFDGPPPADRSLPNSRSGSAVKGGPSGPSEASREAAPLTAGERRLPGRLEPEPRCERGSARRGALRDRSAESQGPSDLEMRKASGPCEVVDRRDWQAKQLRDLVGCQQLVIERDDESLMIGSESSKFAPTVAAPVRGSPRRRRLAPHAAPRRRSAGPRGSARSRRSGFAGSRAGFARAGAGSSASARPRWR